MGRIEGWESVFAVALEESRILPFRWGQVDCLMWSMGIIEAITGYNPASKHKGKYKCHESSLKYLEKQKKSFHGLVDDKFKRIKVIEAGRGDLVYYEGALGICDGLWSFFMKEPGGLVPVKTAKCKRAWRVG